MPLSHPLLRWSCLHLVVAGLTVGLFAPRAAAQFIATATGAGPFDYNATTNWTSSTINGVFSQTPAVAQQVTFATNTTLTTGLTFSLGGSATSLALLGTGTNVTLTLAGDIGVSGTTSSITLGAASPNKLDVNLGGADRTFTVDSGDSLTFQNSIGGSNAVTKAGTGTLTYNGANTYSGTTTVNGGTLALGASGTLPAAANIVVNATTAASTALLTLGAGFTQTSGTLTFGGTGQTVSSTNTVTLNAGSTLTLGGTVTYNATGNPTTQSNINGSGTLALGANRTFDVADSSGTNSELNIYTPISGAGLSLTKTGAGRLALNGPGTTYDGGTIINAGNIFLNASGTLASGGSVTVNDISGSTSTLVLGNNFTQTISTLTFGGSGAATTSVNNVSLNPGSTLTLGGTVTYDATGNPAASSISGGGTLALGANRTFNIGNSTTTNSELNIFTPISGSGLSLTKTGAGRLALNSASSTYDGGTIVNGGELYLNASNTLVSTGSLTVADTTGGTAVATLGVNFTQTIGPLTFGGVGATSTSANTLFLSSGSTLTLGGTVTYDATGNSSHQSNISGSGTLALGANRIFDIANASGNSIELAISAPASGGSLTKTGAGTLQLSGANTYNGGTIVSAGGLRVTNTTGSGVGTGALTIQSGAFLRGTGFIDGATTIELGGILGTGSTSSTAGTLTFTNGLSLNDGAIFNFQLGTTSDKFLINGGTLTGATANSTLTLNLTAGAGFAFGTYTLFDFSSGAATSSFDVADFAFGTTISGYTYGLSINANRLLLTATAIPEPATCAVMLAGASLLGAAIIRRRRAAQS